MEHRYCLDCGRQVPIAGACQCRSTRRGESPPYHSRIHCRTCGGFVRWRLLGVENGDHPPVLSWECDSCGTRRIQFADCTNVETLCATVLEENLRRTGANVDHDEAHSRLVLEAWRLYLGWRPVQDPDRPPVNFEGYAYSILRRRAFDIYRSTLGRNGEKPLANSISLSAGADYGDNSDDLETKLRSNPSDSSMLDLCLAAR